MGVATPTELKDEMLRLEYSIRMYCIIQTIVVEGVSPKDAST